MGIVRINPVPRKKRWVKAKVDAHAGVRSYDVSTDDGTVCRRNRRHLRLTAEIAAHVEIPSRSLSEPFEEPHPTAQNTGPLQDTEKLHETEATSVTSDESDHLPFLPDDPSAVKFSSREDIT